MGIVVPPPAVAARWNGALELRLRRSPLERFLRSRALPFAAGGGAQVTDNVITATVAILSTGLQLYGAGARQGTLSETQLDDMARIACVVSDELATLIHEPKSWRIAALVSAAQVLRLHIGLSSAAEVSARVARAYDANAPDPASCEIRQHSAAAVATNDESHYRAAGIRIARRLTAAEGAPSMISTARLSDRQRHDLCRPLARR
ncbi:MAG TPA: hypothetical protein VGO37_01715 [Steroidobacteraceae bacterium]|nr:hypothetical protein [Steroidobacteraceae bacterium]